jgi:hypothetical protein
MGCIAASAVSIFPWRRIVPAQAGIHDYKRRTPCIRRATPEGLLALAGLFPCLTFLKAVIGRAKTERGPARVSAIGTRRASKSLCRSKLQPVSRVPILQPITPHPHCELKSRFCIKPMRS